MIKNEFEFEVLVNGKPVREYSHDNKLYIEGKKGTHYSLRFKNNTSKRVLIVPSVDGLNALNGKRATEKDTGYVINGYDSITIDGWRKSNSEVAQFYFSSSDESYADKKGKGENLGVIGCAIIKEVQKPPVIIHQEIIHKTHIHCTDPWCIICHPVQYWNLGGGLQSGGSWNNEWSGTGGGSINAMNCSTGASASSGGEKLYASANFSSQELGTGWGETKHSSVVDIDFERQSYPSEVFEIFYNTRAQLEKIGVDFSSKVQYVAPSAFKQPNEYCEPPQK